ncbi:MAG TPA: hypothetical protein VNA30_03800 [Mycobacteriales bacterium]|nr:hypothetical protein [Mycobacteriales bacterium]
MELPQQRHPQAPQANVQANLRRLVGRSATWRADTLEARAPQHGPRLRAIWAFVGLLVAVAAAGFANEILEGSDLRHNLMVGALLALGVAAAMKTHLSVHIGQRARWDLSPGDFPVGVALVFSGDWGFLLGLLVGSAFAYRAQRGNPVKFLFNVANFTAAGAGALLVRDAIEGHYLGATLAVLTWCFLNHCCVQLVLHLAAGTQQGIALRWEALGVNVLAGLIGTLTGALLGGGSAATLAAPLPLAAVWAFVQLRQQKSDVLRMRRALASAVSTHSSRDFLDIARCLDSALQTVFADVTGDLILHLGTEVRRFSFGPEGVRSVPADRSALIEPWVVESLGRQAHMTSGPAGEVAMVLSGSSTTGAALRLQRASGPLSRVDLPAIAAAVTQAASWVAALDVETLLGDLRLDLADVDGSDEVLARHLLTLQEVRSRLRQAQELEGDPAEVLRGLRGDIALAEQAITAALAGLLNGIDLGAADTAAQASAWTTTGVVSPLP